MTHSITRPALTLATLILAGRSALADVNELTRSVHVRTIESHPVEGRLVSFSLKNGAVLRADSQQKEIPTSHIVRVTFHADSAAQTAEPEVSVPTDATLELAWGDSLTGRLVGSRDDAWIIQATGLGEIAIPMDAVSRLIQTQGKTVAFRGLVEWFFATRNAEDAVLLTNGDVIRGFIAALTAEGLEVDAAAGPIRVPQRLVLAAHFVHPPPTAPPALHAVVHLRHAGRLTATALECDGETVVARLHAGPTAHFPLDRVASIEVVGGRWVWMTGLRPISFEQVPMLSLSWDFRIDRNVAGGPIVVAGEAFSHGLGVHSRSVLVYELDAAYREFVTSFGLDDDSGPLADVNVSILVDGMRRYESNHVRRGTLLGPVRLDVARAGRIELVVDFGANGDVQDRFDWVEPALIR
jgi:hypothetical protein